jgi:phosphohistidine phosphatase
MKTLTLLRHAKSSWKDRNLPDHARPLNRRGEKDAPAMAARISDAGIRPSLILSRPAVRAWNTAKIVAKEINYPIEFLQREQELYMADVGDFLTLLGRQDEKFNSVMLVGHNPGLTDFANYLMPNLADNIPTSGVVSMTVETDGWSLAPGSGVELLVFDYPTKDRL